MLNGNETVAFLTRKGELVEQKVSRIRNALIATTPATINNLFAQLRTYDTSFEPNEVRDPDQTIMVDRLIQRFRANFEETIGLELLLRAGRDAIPTLNL